MKPIRTLICFLVLGLALRHVAQAQARTVALRANVGSSFQFIVYGDARFTDPHDHEAANPEVRLALVKAIDAAHPAFLCFGGDIVYNGENAEDWKIYDSETRGWRNDHLEVFPALGNHDLHGKLESALSNYFQRFPQLHDNRYYSVAAGNVLLLVLDSSLNETDGPQANWLRDQIEHRSPDVQFVAVLMHHPPYTSSSDDKKYGGGHSARPTEQALAKYLEEQQAHMSARIVVFGGHVHNYERHEHGGVTYFVTGGGGAHAYPIERAPDDLFQSKEINYHFLQIDVKPGSMRVNMHRLEQVDGKDRWSEPDSVLLTVATATGAE